MSDQAVEGRPVESSSLQLAQRYHTYMLTRAQAEDNKPAGPEIMASQVEKILNAETEDAIWDSDTGGTVQARDVPGLEVEIRDLRIVRSTREFEDGGENKGYYGSMNVTVLGGPRDLLTRHALRVGDDAVLQTGADLILSKVRSFEARELLPVKGVIQSTDTASGNTVLRLVRMPERVTQASTVQ
jgi:hypothetical protein